MNEALLKSLNSAIDTAIQELVNIDSLAKSDISLQDAKLRPESANGSLPGDNREESALKPEDAHKAESKDEEKNPDAKADEKKDHKEPDGDEKKGNKDEDEEDMDDEKAEKLKAKIQKYEEKKKKAAMPMSAPGAMTKSDLDQVSDTLKKSIVSQVEEMHKSFSERLTQMEGLINKLVSAPQPRQSVSGLAPLAKSNEDVQAANQVQLNKSQVLEKLFELQKSDDKRVDSNVIARVEMGDYSVLSERGINLK